MNVTIVEFFYVACYIKRIALEKPFGKPFRKRQIYFGMFRETVGCIQCSERFPISWSNWYNNKYHKTFQCYSTWSEHRYWIERYCNEAVWMAVLKLIGKKKKCKWTCSLCERNINQNEESVICERCLTWVHLTCTKLKMLPKRSKWFCIGCKRKYQDYKNIAMFLIHHYLWSLSRKFLVPNIHDSVDIQTWNLPIS